MKKPKVLVDIALLGAAYDHQTATRGVHRVAQHLFAGLLESDRCELGFMATSHLAATYDLLTSCGIPPQQSLKYDERNLRLDRSARRTLAWVQNGLSDRRLHRKLLRALMFHYGMATANRQSPPAARFLEGFDIYHSLLDAIPASVLSHQKIKHFLTIYDLIPITSADSVRGKGAEKLGRKINLLSGKSFAFCISDYVRNELLEYNTRLLPEHVFVTPLAASPEIFFPVRENAALSTARKTYGIPDEPYFLTLSSFDPRKNFQQIIESFGKTVESGELSGCNLLIVGSNPERTTFVQDAIARYPAIKSRIITPGFIPDHDLAAIYSGALAFLFPSLSEGFGMPPLEAMQCGVPVISSNTTSMPEVVGDAGILLDPKDGDAWMQAMINISREAMLREDLRARGLRRAAQFTWDNFIDATLEGYRHAISCG